MGIHTPILLGIHDGLDMKDGKGGAAILRIRDSVITLFNRLQPDIVITWGPSGWTGHPDHRLVGNIVSEVFAAKKWGKPYNLFYPEIATGYLPEDKVSYATVDSVYLPVRITLSAVDLQKARTALHCHVSQYTWEYAENTSPRIWNDRDATGFLRPFKATPKIQKDLFYKP
jgi:LmbE family N-acetylglucosaminyl deacetylase